MRDEKRNAGVGHSAMQQKEGVVQRKRGEGVAAHFEEERN